MKYNPFYIIAIFSLYTFMLACQEQTKVTDKVSNLNEHNKDSSYNVIMRTFGLPFLENVRPDSNALVFCETKPFDTSFLIYLQQGVKEIRGVYYEVIPTYHNDINSFAINENQLLYFEGYSFIIDSVKWERVKSSAETLLRSDTAFEIDKACNDCGYFLLGHNFRINKSSMSNRDKYEHYYQALKESFLSNFIQKRKPIMYKRQASKAIK